MFCIAGKNALSVDGRLSLLHAVHNHKHGGFCRLSGRFSLLLRINMGGFVDSLLTCQLAEGKKLNSPTRLLADWSTSREQSQLDHPFPSCSVIAADTLRDLVTFTFDLGQWSYMAGHVVNPSTKFEDPTAIRS